VDTPLIALLNARALGLADEAALRGHARVVCAQRRAQGAGAHVSRSYSFPLALIAWHTAQVGCDIERIAPCDQAFADSISTPAERAPDARAVTGAENAASRDRRITSLWSSKEALAKALGDALAYDPRRLEGPAGWPEGRAGPWRAHALDVGEGYVGWVCWRAQEAQSRELTSRAQRVDGRSPGFMCSCDCCERSRSAC
jgi:hypothetical protein